jgi:hypothetical protein
MLMSFSSEGVPKHPQRKVQMQRNLMILLGVLIVLAIAIQLVPVNRTNPPVVADFDGPAEVRTVLRQSCYDCHSHEVRWPWYSRVAPASWLVAHDVEEAREHLNFSAWGAYDANKRAKLIEEAWEEVEEGEMPLRTYLLVHRDARLSDQDRAILQRWAAAEGDD